MNRFLAGLGLLVATAAGAQSPEAPSSYDFSQSRAEHIRLAESAAPSEVSSKATIYSLERSGYEKVREGSNGFTCLVDRFTPRAVEPSCFDAEGSATTVPARLYVESERGKGNSEDQIDQSLTEMYKSGRFKPPGKGGIVYMMSDHNVIDAGDKIVHGPPHLMFYAPFATAAALGSPPRSTSSPFVIHPGRPDTYIIVIPASPAPGGHESH